MASKILFSNENIVAIDKEAGVLSVPSRQGTAETRRIAGLELQAELGKQIYPVHRLDFEVSGILVFALNQHAHKTLNAAFEAGRVRKTYQAFCKKQKDAPFFAIGQMQEWHSKIVRGKKRSFFAPYGKEALTHARLLANPKDEIFEWELHPITGRSHQLRLELTSHGYPILGDKLYASDVAWSENAIALRCIKMEFLELPEFRDINLSVAKLQL